MNWQNKILLLIIDLALVAASIYLALVMRFEGTIPIKYFEDVRYPYFLIISLTISSLYIFGLYNILWRYAGLDTLFALFQAISLSFGLVAVPVFLSGGVFYPRGVLTITYLLTFFLLGGVRLLLRLVSQGTGKKSSAKEVLILGANDVGETVLREIMRHSDHDYQVVGFVDDDPKKHFMRIHGVSVFGGKEKIPELVEKLKVKELILALPSLSPRIVQEILTIAEPLKLKLKTVPGVGELINGKVTINAIRNVDIEDLLEREPVNVDLSSLKSFLEGKKILITGAGGSIGSEIARQITKFNPQSLLLLGRGENSMHEVLVELSKLTLTNLVPLIADIRDKRKISHILATYSPQIIFHAAAHKHVPLMEEHIGEAVHNNVLATWHLAKEAIRFGVNKFIFLSSDKAVNPSSVMGATKRLGELIVKGFSTPPLSGSSTPPLSALPLAGSARSSTQQHNTSFVAVRFGNVMNSRGSVIPTFRKQIAMGGPVVVTDPTMTRFFMTIPEAVILVLEAAALGLGGEIFVLDMGEPIKILDLARHLITISGFEPEKDIPIVFSGLRPGEKLEEGLVMGLEIKIITPYEKIFKLEDNQSVSLDIIEKGINELERAMKMMDEEVMKEILKTLVPEYLPYY